MNKYIVTYTGRKFYPLDPRADDVHLTDIAHALSNTCRWTGHAKSFYSVAQHAVWVANWVAEIDPRLGLAALHHDSHEAYLADVASPVKQFLWTDSKDGSVGTSPYSSAERALDYCIRQALGITHLNEAFYLIHQADHYALRYEQHNLMASWPSDDTLLDIPLVDTSVLEPLSPLDARSAFLAAHRRYKDLAHAAI